MQDQPERRKRSLTDEDLAALTEALGASSIPSEEHRTHHEFVKRLIEKDRIRAERYEKIKAQVGGWAIVTALGAVGTGAYNGAGWLKDHFK